MTVTAPDPDGYCVVSGDAINDAVEKFNVDTRCISRPLRPLTSQTAH